MLVVQIVFIVAAIIQIFIYLFVFSRLAFYSSPQGIGAGSPIIDAEESLAEGFPISVVICARNEAYNLQKYLPIILQQNYPNFEVVVVNDASTDNSVNVLEELERKFSHLRVIHTYGMERDMAGKKFALTKGIEATQYEYLVFTDADCQPASQVWIREMAKSFTKKRQIVLGYGPYMHHKGNLNKLIQYETLMTALQYLSLGIMGMPYMGVGRNIAYHKSLFTANKGFHNHRHTPSGDDDLFINEVAHAYNTTINVSPNTFCYSEPPFTWKKWYFQKRRHLSTGKFYSWRNKIILGAISMSHFLFYGTLIVVVITQSFNFTIFSLFICRLISQFYTLQRIFKLLKPPLSIGQFLLIDALFILYYGIFGLTIFSKAQVSWKT